MKAALSLLALAMTSVFIGAGFAGCFGTTTGISVGVLTFAGSVYGIYQEYSD